MAVFALGIAPTRNKGHIGVGGLARLGFMAFHLQAQPFTVLAPGTDGLAIQASLLRGQGETVSFRVTDSNASVPVRYTGILPDLFKEGTGVVADGQWDGTTFVASEVLAKHDEDYMPPGVAQ